MLQRIVIRRGVRMMKDVAECSSSSAKKGEKKSSRKTCIAYVTVPTRDIAMQISRAAVGEGLAACANVINGVTSIYAWRGNVEEDSEFLVILKTTQKTVDDLETRVKEIHTADVPCFFTIPMDKVSGPYEDWIIESTKPDQRAKLKKIMEKINELENVKKNLD